MRLSATFAAAVLCIAAGHAQAAIIQIDNFESGPFQLDKPPIVPAATTLASGLPTSDVAGGQRSVLTSRNGANSSMSLTTSAFDDATVLTVDPVDTIEFTFGYGIEFGPNSRSNLDLDLAAVNRFSVDLIEAPTGLLSQTLAIRVLTHQGSATLESTARLQHDITGAGTYTFDFGSFTPLSGPGVDFDDVDDVWLTIIGRRMTAVDTTWKISDFRADGVAVPLPPAGWMGLALLTGLLALGRRRKR